MKNTIKSILVAVALLPVSILQAATVIHAGNAFTGTDDKLTGPVSLIIDNDTISDIRKAILRWQSPTGLSIFLIPLYCQA